MSAAFQALLSPLIQHICLHTLIVLATTGHGSCWLRPGVECHDSVHCAGPLFSFGLRQKSVWLSQELACVCVCVCACFFLVVVQLSNQKEGLNLQPTHNAGRKRTDRLAMVLMMMEVENESGECRRRKKSI